MHDTEEHAVAVHDTEGHASSCNAGAKGKDEGTAAGGDASSGERSADPATGLMSPPLKRADVESSDDRRPRKTRP